MRLSEGRHVATGKSLCRLLFLIERSKLLGMKRQHMRQHDSTYFAVTVPLDRDGYNVVDRIVSAREVATLAGTFALGGRKTGDVFTEIFGRSGQIKTVRYITGSNRLPIWPKLRKLTHPTEIARFMSKWGAIDRSLGMRSEYVASADSLLQLGRVKK